MGILSKLHAIDKLPTLPEVLVEVLKLVSSEDSDAARLAAIIENDPSLSARVLRIANSSYYGSPDRRLSSVSLAVARLGFNEVRTIAIAVSIVKQFAARHSALSYHTFWRHSITCAFLARIVGKQAGFANDENAGQRHFLAGLLHDIGILVLDQFFADKFSAISEQGSRQESSYLAAEKAILGKETHPVIGGALLEMWKLEPAVIDAVRYHHSPSRAPQRHAPICAIVALAEYVLCNSTIGSFEGTFDDIDDVIWERTGFTDEQSQGLLERATTAVRGSDMIVALGERSEGLRPV